MSLSLAIACGRTRNPHRPVNRSRFLIGSAQNCDLRLGGREVPAQHSLIIVRPEGAIIEQIADSPPLLINGRCVEEHTLSHDDLIQIGRFQLDVVCTPAQTAEADNSQRSFDNSQRSFEELVDLSDQWLSQRESGGAKSLLTEVLRRADAISRADVDAASASPKQSEIDQVTAQLARFSRSLTARSEQLSQRESAIKEAEASLLESQAQVEQLLERMQQLLETRTETNDGPSLQSLRFAA